MYSIFSLPFASDCARIVINNLCFLLFFFYFCHYSAVIEHTNRVIFLEDDDVAAVVDGRLSIHRIKRTAGDYPARAIQTLQMELQQIMKGKYKLVLSSEHFSLTIVHVCEKCCPEILLWKFY